PKPAPDTYLTALHRFGAVGKEAVAIEDSARGLRSAMAAGIDCMVVYNAFTASQDFSGAWRMLHTIRELPGVLAGSSPLAGDSGDAANFHLPRSGVSSLAMTEDEQRVGSMHPVRRTGRRC